jgi:hypothetical protein
VRSSEVAAFVARLAKLRTTTIPNRIRIGASELHELSQRAMIPAKQTSRPVAIATRRPRIDSVRALPRAPSFATVNAAGARAGVGDPFLNDHGLAMPVSPSTASANPRRIEFLR